MNKNYPPPSETVPDSRVVSEYVSLRTFVAVYVKLYSIFRWLWQRTRALATCFRSVVGFDVVGRASLLFRSVISDISRTIGVLNVFASFRMRSVILQTAGSRRRLRADRLIGQRYFSRRVKLVRTLHRSRRLEIPGRPLRIFRISRSTFHRPRAG